MFLKSGTNEAVVFVDFAPAAAASLSFLLPPAAGGITDGCTAYCLEKL